MSFLKRKYLFNDLLTMWLQTKQDIKIQSLQKYENVISKYLKNNLGNIYIHELSSDLIDNFFKKLKVNKVSISIQKTLLYIIKATLRLANQNNYCDYIKLDNIKFKSNLNRVQVFSKEEQQKLESYLKDKLNIRKVCLLLCLYTGLRIGEVCGLKWEDINFNTKYLEIKRTIERIKNNESDTKTILIESTPKSSTSKRIVPIPNFLIEILKKYKTENNFFVLSNSLNLYDPRQFEAFYKRIIKKCGISYTKFHTLRHTFATRSIESKMDIKTLSEILGHASIEITLKLYVHPTYEMKKNSIESLVKFMNNIS